MDTEWMNKSKESCSFIQNIVKSQPKIAIVLGSGLGGIANQLVLHQSISFADIPYFPVSTVVGHQGTMLFGTLNGVEVCVLNGRKHFYEGAPMQDVVFPIYVLKALGIRTLILSNAAGGLNPVFRVGDIMVLNGHINHIFSHPLRAHQETYGMMALHPVEVYSRRLIQLTHTLAQEQGLRLMEGVYLAHSGPYFGTQAESRMQYRLGADAVGMSTIPEAIVAKSLNINVLAFSVITDLANGYQEEHPSHEAVLQAATLAGDRLVKLVMQLVKQNITFC